MRGPGFLETIVSADPQGQAFRFLTHLLRDAQASGGAVLIEAERQPRLWVAVNVARAQETMDAWRAALKLLAGSGLHSKDGVLLAALRANDQLVGVLQLEGAQSFDAARHADHLAVLGHAIVAATQPRQAVYGVEELIGRDDRRTQAVTLDLLKRHEWNISKVAREMGITRRTLYLRLGRWRIPRLRPRKA